jgi:pimeloyl-ACP methyl ester carboxylesterase
MGEPTRLVPTGWDDEGHVVAESILSPTQLKVRAMCLVPSNLIVPLIFVPGIMGTRLRTRDDKKKEAWIPPEGAGATIWAALKGMFMSASTRQRLLNPHTTEVDDNGPAHPSDTSKNLLAIAKGKTLEERTKWRGWGALHGESYRQILNDLEERFAMIFDPHSDGECMDAWWKAEVMGRGNAAKTGAQKPFAVLTEQELKDAAEPTYPVHAVGYNWLQSNRQSGEQLLEKIKDITAHYRSLGKFCEKVVIVTHSMGGLVARACVQLPGAADLVLGVVHGVMPASGAPATYKRMRSGFEGAAQVVLGRNAADCTAVMSNAPGPLELLPMKSYQTKGADGQPRHWLRVSFPETASTGRTSDRRDVLLGEGDPYAQIYLNNDENNWWRLVKEELINPAKLDESGRPMKKERASFELGEANFQQSDFHRYRKLFKSARILHDLIDNKYHPNTYVFYAADAERPAWNEVCWRGSNPGKVDVQAASTIDDDLNGIVRLKLGAYEVAYEIEDAKGPGDETVPAESGEAPKPYVVQIFRHEGQAKGHDSYGHQHAYRSKLAQAVTLYGIVKIVAGSDWLQTNKCHA